MLEALLKRLGPRPSSAAPADDRLAAAILLVECARADFEACPLEQGRAESLMAQAFGLDATAAARLLEQAREAQGQMVSLHGVVAVLNARLEPARRRELIGWLWQLAYADGRLDPQEEGLLRRLADLLHVPHAAFIQEKLQVLEGSPPAS